MEDVSEIPNLMFWSHSFELVYCWRIIGEWISMSLEIDATNYPLCVGIDYDFEWASWDMY